MQIYANNCLVDVWQRASEEILDYENEMQQPTVHAMPTGMVVQYIPNGLLIFFGQPIEEDFDEYGF